jgi:hypothetical protein
MFRRPRPPGPYQRPQHQQPQAAIGRHHRATFPPQRPSGSHHLQRSRRGGESSDGWHHNDLSASAGAPPAAGDPKGYVFEAQRTQQVVYRGADNGNHELWSAGPNWSHTDLSA